MVVGDSCAKKADYTEILRQAMGTERGEIWASTVQNDYNRHQRIYAGHVFPAGGRVRPGVANGNPEVPYSA